MKYTYVYIFFKVAGNSVTRIKRSPELRVIGLQRQAGRDQAVYENLRPGSRKQNATPP